jgi:type II secretory pathway component PulM
MTGDGSGAAENAARREEVAMGIVTSVAAAAGARVHDNEKEKEGTDATTGGGVAANRLSSSSGAVQLEPLVVDLTILTKAVDTGAGTGNL